MPGKDLSAELFGDSAKPGGKDLSADLFGDEPVKKQDVSMLRKIGQGLGNIAAGGVRGAGSIGATILTPYDLLAGNTSSWGNPERRSAMDAGLQELGADPTSLAYKTGKLGTEIAGTLPVGGLLGGGLAKSAAAVSPAAARAVAPLAQAITSGGLKAQDANLLTRMVGGAINAGGTGLLLNPNDTSLSSVIGGAIPLAGYLGGKLGEKTKGLMGSAAQSLMQSALKPTKAARQSGEADAAIRTLLNEGINVTKGGAEKLQGRIDDLNSQIADSIKNSTSTISKQNVAKYADEASNFFRNQVSPTSDLAAIDAVKNDFLVHPAITGDNIPVQLAQQLKQGTYQALKKKYGQVAGASEEAQKSLARGLKDEIANAVPGVAELNKRDSELINALKVLNNRVSQQGNNNPLGLSSLSPSIMSMIVHSLDRSSLAKSLAARGANNLSTMTAPGLLTNDPATNLIRQGLLSYYSTGR